jgi:gentisate 1,2-dioxygenase
MVAANPMDPSRREFYGRIDAEHLAPLWEVMAALVPPAPRSVCEPVHWSFAEVLPHLQQAGRLISAEEAERRVLVLENPALRGKSCVTRSLYAGLQLLLPGEIAHSHRHTATAIRLVVQGRGAYTSVDGERTPMEPGDFIITPSWTFHDHANPGSEPVVWLDGLDVPVIQFLEAGFSERYPFASQPLTRGDDDSLVRYAHSMAPIGDVARPGRNPLFRYPYVRTRASLQRLAVHGPVHRCHGVKQQFVDPTTGGPATATMAAFMQWLPGGFRGMAYRATDSTVFCVVEGCGKSHIGEHSFEWKPHDVFVVPSWLPVRHDADADAVLFSFSDRPVQQALRVWREEAID